jgi:hypothetical protein
MTSNISTIFNENDINLGVTTPMCFLIYNGKGGGDENNLLFFTDGRRDRISIGVTDPQAKISVKHWGDDGLGINFLNNNTEIGVTFGMDSNEDLVIQNGETAKDIIFYTEGSERMKIENGGFIGIGTNNPNENFHIYEASTPNMLLTNSSSTNGSRIGLNSSNQLEIRNRDNEAIRVYVNDTEAMRIKADGNVGIGTNNPLELLHIHAATAGDSFLRFSGTDAVGGSIDTTTALGAYAGTIEVDINGTTQRIPFYD